MQYPCTFFSCADVHVHLFDHLPDLIRHQGHDHFATPLQVHVDPVITVNGGVHIGTNDSEAMPLLTALLPPSPPLNPPPPSLSGATAFLDSGADNAPATALPPVTPEQNAAFNAGPDPSQHHYGTRCNI